jgi:signal transduction histidine kinase
MRSLLVVTTGFLVITAFGNHPAPGTQGQHLGVTIALAGIVVGSVGLPVSGLSTRASRAASAAQALVFVVVIALSSATLAGLQPSGAGDVGVFIAVGAGGFRLPMRVSAGVAVLAVISLALALGLSEGHSVGAVVSNELGVVAFYMVSRSARRLQEAKERSQLLVHELEETRAAQAQSAVLAERQRLAREMHDVLAHSLSGLALNLESARLLAENTGADGKVSDSIDRAHQLARTGLDEARRAIGMLRDDALPGPERLSALATELEVSSGVSCSFLVEGDERDLGPEGWMTLYRVTQEAVTNIGKHSNAERAEVRLAYEPDGTRLTVDDFAPAGGSPVESDGSGYGLTGMRERAELLGGILTARPTECGFHVELWVPR